MRFLLLITSGLSIVASPAHSLPADPEKTCTVKMETPLRPARLQAMIAAPMSASMDAGTRERRQKLVTALAASDPIEWICSAEGDRKDCCDGIPVYVDEIDGECFASLPYSKLSVSIKRASIRWVLTKRGLGITDYVFDKKNGIRVMVLPGEKRPLGKGTHKGQEFEREVIQTKGLKAGHEAFVFPAKAGKPDEENPCSPLDPLITNID